MTSRFRVGVEIDTAFMIGEPHTVTYGDKSDEAFAVVSIRDSNSDDAPHLLQFVCTLSAASIRHAIGSAFDRVSFLADVLSLAARAPHGTLRLVSCFELPCGDGELKSFLHTVPHQILEQPVRELKDREAIALLISQAAVAVSDQSVSRRLRRALAAYVNGLSTQEATDRFEDFWQGLEALNPIAKVKLDLPDELQSCGRCGESKKIQTVVGIRGLCQRALGQDRGLDVYKRSRKVRQGLQHGFMTDGELALETRELEDDLGLVLAAAFRDLFELETVHTEDGALHMKDVRQPYFEGHVREEELAARLEIQDVPRFEVVRAESDEIETIEGDKKAFSAGLTIKTGSDLGIVGTISFAVPVQRTHKVEKATVVINDESPKEIEVKREVNQ
jgi:hypothetical protein